MKQRKMLVIAVFVGMLLVAAMASQAQDPMQAAGQAQDQMQAGGGQAQKLAMLSKQLNLTPEQKMKLMPILEAEGPKVQAIKSNTSLTNMQKMEQLRALHEQTNPEVQKILSPQQYEQLQQIRQHELEQAMRKRAQPM
jgi:opacity protein-like surface antigen